jgi:signal peptidase I
MKRRVASTVLLCMLVSSCSLVSRRTVNFQGNSMLPSIKDGDSLSVVNLDSNSRNNLTRGDVVVFRYPLDQSKSYIKRVIGLPGDKVEIRGTKVWLNDTPLSEPYLNQKLNNEQRSYLTTVVPRRSYFVLGDNRDNSSDSRVWGFVSEELIEAKVVSR